MHMRRILPVVLAITTLVSCRDVTAPAAPTFSGEYVLQRIDADSLPTTIYQDQFIIQRVTSSYLEIDDSNQSFYLILNYSLGPASDTTKSSPHSTADQGIYHRSGDSMSFGFIGSADPVPATIGDGVIIVHTATLGDWEYRR